jgi:hypothetical protein
VIEHLPDPPLNPGPDSLLLCRQIDKLHIFSCAGVRLGLLAYGTGPQ